MRHITRPTVPTAWHVSEAARVRGRILAPGRVVRVSGDRGAYAFLRHVRNVDTGAEWLDVRDVATGALRAFRADRIRAVTGRTVDAVPVGGRRAAAPVAPVLADAPGAPARGARRRPRAGAAA